MAEAPASSSFQLLLHPLTHEVYALDEAIVFHDFSNYVDVDFADFEKFTQTGPCSAERIVEYAKRRHGAFHFTQLVFIKMKGHSNDQPRFAWASRICVRINQEFPYISPGGAFGAEFLWIWPPSAAINAFLSYQERNRLSMANTTVLEQYAPSVSHQSAAPGAQIGPDDFEGAVRVPLAQLSAEKRFFIACIRPQRTQFQRRRLTDQWPAAMRDAENAANLKFWLSCMPSNSAVEAKVIADAMLWAREATKRPTEDVPVRKQVCFLGLSLGELPDELLTRIVGFALAGAMTEHITRAAATICSLRRVSKHLRAATDGFVGMTLEQITVRMEELVCTGGSEPVRALSDQIRAIGITPRLALELRAHVNLVSLPEASVRLYPQLRNNSTVPKWQSYLAMRKENDSSVAGILDEKYVSTKERPSKAYKRLRVLGHSNSPNVETRPEYDCLIDKGSVPASEMLELVGV